MAGEVNCREPLRLALVEREGSYLADMGVIISQKVELRTETCKDLVLACAQNVAGWALFALTAGCPGQG